MQDVLHPRHWLSLPGGYHMLRDTAGHNDLLLHTCFLEGMK